MASEAVEMNETIIKFGYPETLLRDYQHWVLLLRPAQVTAGSLILAAKSEATAYGELPQAAFTEQAAIVAELERLLKNKVNHDKLNYLMLMMVDPHVHFHIFPRYSGDRSIAGLVLTELHPGVTVDDIRAKTGAPFDVALKR